jgi:hypothetical protein
MYCIGGELARYLYLLSGLYFLQGAKQSIGAGATSAIHETVN